ncbi:MAG: TonB-dependent receptor [Deltaproteobacteria bacterium]|nr:TonB-dependent receptor [Deltaproteobacteria bacterium]
MPASAQDASPGGSSGSSGSSGADPFAGVEEMVVVGTGAAALLQTQEVSAIKFDANYLQALGASDLSDISQFTPNLEIRTPFAASNPTLFIRGVGIRDFNANSSSSVAVYNDEIYMNSPAGQLAQLFDVENVDVLRGPQTTMYGRNSSAGTIRVVAKKPTSTPGATFRATYGRFNQVQLEGAVENVIVPDVISMRSSFRTNARDGFVRNRCADPGFNTNPGLPITQSRAQRVFNQCFNTQNTSDILVPFGGLGWNVGEVPPVKQWVNDQSNWGARTLLRAQQEVGEVGLDFILNFHGGQNRGDARQFQVVGAQQRANEIKPSTRTALDANGYVDPDNQFVVPGTANVKLPINSPFDGNPYEGDYNNVEKEKLDLFGTSLVGKLDYGAFSLTSVTGYEWNKRHVELNLDGNPYLGLEPVLGNEARQVTQELRVDYDADQGFRWQLGGMYLYEGLQVDNQFVLGLTNPVIQQGYGFFTRYGTGWLNLAWEPVEAFKVEGGARVNYEDKELNLRSFRSNLATGERVCQESPTDLKFCDQTAVAATKKVGAAGDLKGTWTPVEDVSFYLRYARGWKGPHINGGVVFPNSRTSNGDNLTTPVDPEEIDSVELGMKSMLWGKRLTANWALFYYDYNNIQIFRLLNVGGGVPVQQLVNADDADVLGFEAEFDVKPFEDWGPLLLDKLWIHVTFAWLDSKYTDFVNTQTVQPETAIITLTEDFSGNRLINSPEYSFIGFIAWPLGGDWGAVIPRLDWTFKDKVYFDVSNSNLLKQDPLWLLNFRLTYKAPTENFELSAWVENLTDQAYTVDVFNLARLRQSILHAVGDPRTYGVTATVKF